MTTHVLWVLIHSLALVVFINRYLAGVILRMARGNKWDETREWEPTVTAVIPMFIAGATIQETLHSILDSDYPHAKLKIICVDDCSTDNSYELAREVARSANGRLRVIRNPINVGKRRSIIRAVREAECDVILSVDSDVVVDKDAVRQLMRRFTSDRIAAVGGWVDVRNKQDNWLTRMQVVRYWFAYNFMKNLEWGFRRVLCLSGCLTAYRRDVLIELEPVLEHRAICGVPIKYGEDRFLTRQIIKGGWLTTMTLTARCYTTVPTTLSGYFSQQLRWRRSNTIDYAGGFTHVWRLNPVIAIHYFSLFALQFAYPIAIVRAATSHKFFAALIIHLMIIAVFGFFYRWRVRKYPREDRVSAVAFLPLAVLMPVAWSLLAPLALFTLDSGSWETRGVPEVATGTGAVRVEDVASGPILVPAVAAEARKRVGRGTGSQSELPAA
jgi:cellulose synthase/poly-beta-1,6-N-acetylglucosamine synthase-like glycosyltransferase